MKVNIEMLVWNFVLYAYSVLAAFLVIQHSVFIYGTLDGSKMIPEPWYWYYIIGAIIWVGFKLAHHASERGELFPSEDEAGDE